MTGIGAEGRSERAKSLIAVAAIHAALGYAFLTGLTPTLTDTVEASLKLFEIGETPPPPPKVETIPPPPKESSSAPEGEAAPPNLKSASTPIVAPPPEIRIEIPPTIAAAPLPAQGSDRSSGAAEVAGPGTGAGGVGTGTGGGGRGGTGVGDGSGTDPVAALPGFAVPPRLLRGRFRNSDYPRTAAKAKVGGTVMVSYRVDPDGRPRGCAIVRSSGHADLDGITCHVIQTRFLYAPARDAEGRPVRADTYWEQEWFRLGGRRR